MTDLTPEQIAQAIDLDEELGERELSCQCCVAVDMTGLQMLKDALAAEKARADKAVADLADMTRQRDEAEAKADRFKALQSSAAKHGCEMEDRYEAEFRAHCALRARIDVEQIARVIYAVAPDKQPWDGDAYAFGQRTEPYSHTALARQQAEAVVAALSPTDPTKEN